MVRASRNEIRRESGEIPLKYAGAELYVWRFPFRDKVELSLLDRSQPNGIEQACKSNEQTQPESDREKFGCPRTQSETD
ncbi:hypothetical protein [Bradyrhizobium icense]|uniref:hypothetical protein n=1 Tax=Bradyrhizobium icense TaxID=1274631 RepID=UPI0012E9F638|nr:hypothetical protein [Bradyrhizobium icense]